MTKKIKYMLFIICLFLLRCLDTNALTYGGCEYSDISRLKSIVSNINIYYDYHLEDRVAYFDVTVSNIIPDIYFVDSQTGMKYTYENSIDGEIRISNYTNVGGHYRFYSALNDCYGIKLSNKYYSFPTYNIYYNDPLCENNRSHVLCQKWQKIKYTYTEFQKIISEYNDNKQGITEEEKEPIYQNNQLNHFVIFYTKYYYFILIGIILVCITIMYISSKKNKFDL